MSDYHYNYNYNDPYGRGPSPGPGPGGRPPQEGDKWETIAWVIDVGLIFLVNGLGLFLTIAHALGHDFIGNFLRRAFGQAGGGTAWNPPARERKAPEQGGTAGEPAKAPEKAAEKAPAQGVRRADAGSGIKTVFGWILAIFGLLSTLSTTMNTSIWAFLTSVAVTVGGGVLIVSGRKSRKKEAKFRRCLAVSGSTGIVDIGKLAGTMGWEGAEADRVLSEMVDRGYYGARAYIDHARGLLVIEPEAMRDVYQAEDEAKAAQDAETARAGQTEYERYVELIRQADEDIADEAMSEKIRRMQSITAAIFQEVEAHPEKKSQITRFMNYYLPTTLKLLKSYAQIEARGVSGENMAKAKADIERIADTLVAGYEKQLDTLYRAEAMDIAGDVSTIENMMKRDGLTGQSDFGQPLGGT